MKSVVSAEQQSAKAGERIENGDKDKKKKKRRGSRRSKNASGNIMPSASSVSFCTR